MDPYRAPAAPGRRIVSFGDGRRPGLLALASFGLMALTVGPILWWLHSGGGIHGSILLPAVAGLALLFRRRGGTIEHLPERGELHIQLRSVVFRRQVRVPVAEITGLTVSPSNFKDKEPEYELSLLRGGVPDVRLLSARDAAKLEPARAAVSSFLLEQGLLRARVEVRPRFHQQPAEDADVPAEAARPPDPARGIPRTRE